MKKQDFKTLRGMLIAGGMGAAFGFGALWLMRPALRSLPKLGKVVALEAAVAVVVCMFGLILLHELGHLLGGLLVGFEFSFLTTGPLRIYRQDGKLHVSWNKSLELWGGIAACFPKDFKDLNRRMLVMVAGGPLASLVVGAALWLLAPLVAPHLAIAMRVLGATSLALGAVNAIPMQNGRFQSDGGKIRTLLAGGPECDRMVAMTTLAVQLMGGARPRDFQPELVKMLEPVPEISAETFGVAYLLSQYAFDRGDFATSAALLDRLLENVNSLAHFQRPFVYLEGAFWEARMRKNPGKAREYQALGKDVPPGLIKERTFLFTEAVILAAEGRVAEAGEVAKKALGLPATLGGVLETELLEDMAGRAG